MRLTISPSEIIGGVSSELYGGQIVVDRSLLYAERLGDFDNGEALFLQGASTRGRGFSRS